MLEVGTKAPEFTLPDQNGEMHSLSDYKGQKVILLLPIRNLKRRTSFHSLCFRIQKRQLYRLMMCGKRRRCTERYRWE